MTDFTFRGKGNDKEREKNLILQVL